jgi:hypothetical protein
MEVWVIWSREIFTLDRGVGSGELKLNKPLSINLAFLDGEVFHICVKIAIIRVGAFEWLNMVIIYVWHFTKSLPNFLPHAAFLCKSNWILKKCNMCNLLKISVYISCSSFYVWKGGVVILWNARETTDGMGINFCWELDS